MSRGAWVAHGAGMRRGLRWVFRILAALVVLIGVAVVALVSPVDDRPYLRTAYHSNTVVRLNAALASLPTAPERQVVKAGWARVKLTPTMGTAADVPAKGEFRWVPLAGFGARRGAPAEGVHDDVWVKALALESGGRRVVFVGIDALIVPREVSEAVAVELGRSPGLRREELYLGATHTHSSVGGWGEGVVAEAFAGDFQPGVRTWMTHCLVEAVRGALAGMGSAEVAVGSFRAPGQVRNRLVGEAGRVDDEFSLLVVKKAEGGTAVLGAFAAHATVLGSGNRQFSGDYPGHWAAEVEKATGGMAVFIAGGVGSHSPQTGAGTDFERVAGLGSRLALETVGRVSQMKFQSQVELAVAGIEVDLPPLNPRVSDDIRIRPWAAEKLLPVRPTSFLQGVRIGDTVWVSTPCDFSGELALVLKEHAQSRGRRLTVTSFNGDYIGYVIPTKYYHLGGYEPQTMSFHGPATADYFEELIRRLVDGI